MALATGRGERCPFPRESLVGVKEWTESGECFQHWACWWDGVKKDTNCFRQSHLQWLFGLVVLINVVALRRARLVLGWVTVSGYTILVFNHSHPDLLSLAIPPWVGTMSTGGGLGHR